MKILLYLFQQIHAKNISFGSVVRSEHRIGILNAKPNVKKKI